MDNQCSLFTSLSPCNISSNINIQKSITTIQSKEFILLISRLSRAIINHGLETKGGLRYFPRGGGILNEINFEGLRGLDKNSLNPLLKIKSKGPF